MDRLGEFLKRFKQSTGWVMLECLLTVISVASVFGAVRAQREAKNQTDELRSISKSLSTRKLAEFPKNLPDITEMISHAKVCAEVWADVIGYGKFSAPDDFREYQRTLENRAQKIDVTVHYYDAETMLHQRLRQFQPDQADLYPAAMFPEGKPPDYKNSFEAFRQGQPFQRYVKGLAPDATPTKWEAFISLLRDKDALLEGHLRQENVKVDRYKGLRSVFVWMIDRSTASSGEAIFSISGDGGKETAFYTRDAALLDSLYTIVQPPENRKASGCSNGSR